MKSTKQIALGFALVSVTSATLVGVAASQQSKQSRSQTASVMGLRELAAEAGFYRGRIAIRDEGAPPSLAGLVDASELIIVGKVASNVSRLTSDGLSIVIAYDVVVESVLKHSGRPPVMVTVLVPGGRVSFEDGSMAELRAPGFAWPMNGSRQVWFLNQGSGIIPKDKELAHTTDGIYIPAFGPLGVYQLRGGGLIVRPSGLYRTPLGRSIVRARKLEVDFIADVKAAVARARPAH